MLERFGHLFVVALALQLSVLVPVSAEESGASPGEPPKVSEFYETTTVVTRPIATATEAVTVLDREEIEALDVVSVAELIRFIPGLDVTATGPRGGLATAQIRGGEPNFTVVLLDGVPLNDTTDPLGGELVRWHAMVRHAPPNDDLLGGVVEPRLEWRRTKSPSTSCDSARGDADALRPVEP